MVKDYVLKPCMPLKLQDARQPFAVRSRAASNAALQQLLNQSSFVDSHALLLLPEIPPMSERVMSE